jgi:hypothetical protein
MEQTIIVPLQGTVGFEDVTGGVAFGYRMDAFQASTIGQIFARKH